MGATGAGRGRGRAEADRGGAEDCKQGWWTRTRPQTKYGRNGLGSGPAYSRVEVARILDRIARAGRGLEWQARV